ncbi:NmrA family NAD(P)-binding protein [Deinococcus sp. UYEF24]
MIVITTPTSNIGQQVLRSVLQSGAAVRVIARDPSKISADLLDRVEVVQGSHGDLDVVMKAFEGADTVFWLPPADPQAGSVEAAYLDFSRPACEAFERRGIKRVVGVSALGRGTPQARHAGYVTGSLAMDDLIASSGVSYRALTMPSFMDNLVHQAGAIRNLSQFFGSTDGDLRVPTCSTSDIAAVATRWLLDASWSGTGHVAVLGPEDLSCHDMARVMSEVLGKPVTYHQISLEVYKAQYLGFGYSEAMAQGMTDMGRAKNDGLDNAEPRTSENTTPTSFRQWCETVLKPALLD